MEKEENIQEADNNKLTSMYEEILYKTTSSDDSKENKKDAELEETTSKNILAVQSKEQTSDTSDEPKENNNIDRGQKEIKEVQQPEKDLTDDIQKKQKEELKSSIEDSNLEHRLQEARKWGQERNRALINSKRSVTNIVQKLAEDGTLVEEDVQKILTSLNSSIDQNEEASQEEQTNPFLAIKEKMDNEFKTYRRYNKESDLDDKYKAFYAFFPMLSEKEQEETFTYLQDAEPDDALDYVMTHGIELHNTLFKGMKERGGLLKYVQSLQKKLNKLERENTGLQSELDSTTKKVHNKNVDSKAETFINKASTAESLYEQRYKS